MPNDSEELRLRDAVIGLRAEISEANFQRNKAAAEHEARVNALEALRIKDQEVIARLAEDIAAQDAELVAVRQSRTWRVGRWVLAPSRWLKRGSH